MPLTLFDLQTEIYKLTKKHGRQTPIVSNDLKRINVVSKFHEDLEVISLNFYYEKDTTSEIEKLKG